MKKVLIALLAICLTVAILYGVFRMLNFLHGEGLIDYVFAGILTVCVIILIVGVVLAIYGLIKIILDLD